MTLPDRVSLPGHELRNPLHGICAGVKALQDGTLTPAEAAEELAAIAEGTALMVSITSDMTDLSKLRAGHFRVQLAPTLLRAVLDACVRAALPVADRPSDIQLDYDCAGGVPESVRRGRVGGCGRTLLLCARMRMFAACCSPARPLTTTLFSRSTLH